MHVQFRGYLWSSVVTSYHVLLRWLKSMLLNDNHCSRIKLLYNKHKRRFQIGWFIWCIFRKIASHGVSNRFSLKHFIHFLLLLFNIGTGVVVKSQQLSIDSWKLVFKRFPFIGLEIWLKSLRWLPDVWRRPKVLCWMRLEACQRATPFDVDSQMHPLTLPNSCASSLLFSAKLTASLWEMQTDWRKVFHSALRLEMWPFCISSAQCLRHPALSQHIYNFLTFHFQNFRLKRAFKLQKEWLKIKCRWERECLDWYKIYFLPKKDLFSFKNLNWINIRSNPR